MRVLICVYLASLYACRYLDFRRVLSLCTCYDVMILFLKIFTTCTSFLKFQGPVSNFKIYYN
jgi:hypothetical protein